MTTQVDIAGRKSFRSPLPSGANGDATPAAPAPKEPSGSGEASGRPIWQHLLLLALGIALPLLTLAGILAYSYGSSERTRIETEAVKLAHNFQVAIDREFSGLMAATNVLAASPFLTSDDLDGFDKMAREVSPKIGVNIVVRDASHRQVVNTRLPRGSPLPTSVDIAGDLRVSASGRAEVSDLFIGGFTRTPLVMISAPVFRDGELRYFVNPSIPPERIRDVILSEQVPAGWIGAVVDRKGVMVARTRNHDQFVGEPGAPGFIEEVEKKSSGIWRGLNIEGTESAIAYARSPLSGWVIGAAVPVSLLNQPLRTATGWFAAAAAALIALSVLFAWLLGRRLSRSVVALVGAGDALTRNVPIASLSSPVREVTAVHAALSAALTRRQEYERTIARALQRAEVAQDAAAATAYEFCPATGEVFRDHLLMRVLGYLPQDLEATKGGWRALIHPDDVAEFDQRLEEAFRDREGFKLEYRVKHKDGRFIWVADDARLFRSAEGEVERVVGMVSDIAWRKDAEAALRKSEESIRAILESSPYAMLTADREGRIALANKRAERLFGYSREELLGSSIDRLIPERFRRQHASYAAEFNASPTARPMGAGRDLCCLHKDGSEIPAEIGLGPVRTADGEFVVISVIDITDRKRAEEKLRESEEKFRLFVDHAPAAVAMFDRDMRYVAVSRRWLSDYRLDPRIIGRNHYDVFPEIPEHWKEIHRRALAGAVESCDAEPFRRPEETYWIAWEVRPWFDAAGAVGGILIITEDVTARQNAGERLRSAEERLRLAMSAGQIGTWDLNPQTGENRWDQECKRLFGIAPEVEVSYDLFLSMIHPQDRERVQRSIAQALELSEEGNYRIEYRIIVAGEERWIAAQGQAIKAEYRGVREAVRFVGTAMDITARKRAEEHRTLLLHELNHRVKNTLATVQSIAMQTFKTSELGGKATQAFQARLAALACAHDVLTRENWESADLRDIVAQAVAPHCGEDPDRFLIEGPRVRLTPKATLALAMGLHELCTNAAKYGALSTPEGRVGINWAVESEIVPPRLRLRWTESGGPPVEKPTRHGFGSRLVERLLANDLDAEIKLEYAPTGVTCSIDAPLTTAER